MIIKLITRRKHSHVENHSSTFKINRIFRRCKDIIRDPDFTIFAEKFLREICVRLCKTKTNDDALEVVADFDDHCGLFATSSSSAYK